MFLILGYGGIIAAGEVTPILPVAGEKQPDNITKFFFDALLQFMVSEVAVYFILQGPVVQSIISLMSSLRGQLIKCFTTL